MKPCTLCARDNPTIAVVCAYCGAAFVEGAPANAEVNESKTDITLVGLRLPAPLPELPSSEAALAEIASAETPRRSRRTPPLSAWLFFARSLRTLMAFCGALLLVLSLYPTQRGNALQILPGATGFEYAYYFELLIGGMGLLLAGVLPIPPGIRSLCAALFGLAGFLLGSLMLRLHMPEAFGVSRHIGSFLLSSIAAATLGTMGLLQLFGILMRIAPEGQPRDEREQA